MADEADDDEDAPPTDSSAVLAATGATGDNGTAARAPAANGLDDAAEVQQDELCALIQAIQFAHSDFGVRKTFREITGKGGRWEAVKLGHVKKAWKAVKAHVGSDMMEPCGGDAGSMGAGRSSGGAAMPGDRDPSISAASAAADVGVRPVFMTVGTNPGDIARAREEMDSSCAGQPREGTTGDDWVGVELNVAMDRSGAHAHQAVLSFNHAKAKKGKARGDKGEILKIQVAHGAPDDAPMLLYNRRRDRKSFIHHDAPAFAPIRRLVLASGGGGELGTLGGLKAYFWGHVNKAHGTVSINIAELAPAQPW